MATTLPLADAAAPPSTGAATLLVCMPAMAAETQSAAVANLREAFPEETLLLAGVPGAIEYAAPRSQVGWVLAAQDYAAAAATLNEHAEASAVLLLSADVSTLPARTLRQLAESIRSGGDLAVPRYPVGPNSALVSSAILYPLSRALFSADIRFPLPVDAAVSLRLLHRLGAAGARAANQTGAESLLWPVAEAVSAGMRVQQIDTAERTLPSPPDQDVNSLLAAVAGSLFADIEAKAAFWQRGRALTPATTPVGQTPDQAAEAAASADTAALIENFRLAASNLTEIWSIVLSPQTLVALKKLSRATPEEFALDAGTWARIVYDFALAFHLRTLNRGHLLGAMTPLYYAWVASHIRAAQNDAARAARLVEAAAQAFEREKPYFVSRWRWPDRFNP